MNASAIAVSPYLFHGRDLRLDFMRGLVMLVVICVHVEYLSLFSMFMWGRLGWFSSAEGFVLLSGVVLGVVYKKHLLREGFRFAASKLLRRAWQLYRVRVVMALVVLGLSYLPLLNSFEITHWVSPVHPDIVYRLIPPPETPWLEVAKQLLLLQFGPHQFQIIGLYAVLITVSPLVLYLLYRQQTDWILLLSWTVYALNSWMELRPTVATFEYAFPTLSWQLLFFNGMVIGFHQQRVFSFLTDSQQRGWIQLATLLLCLGMLWAQLDPTPLYWPLPAPQYIEASLYRDIHNALFQKDLLGIGRILNNLVFYIFLFCFISRNWPMCQRYLGWLVIPIGQSSLYVFIWHVYFVLLWSNTPLPQYHNFWLNTLMHTLTIGLIWLMVKQRFLFNVVPR